MKHGWLKFCISVMLNLFQHLNLQEDKILKRAANDIIPAKAGIHGLPPARV